MRALHCLVFIVLTEAKEFRKVQRGDIPEDLSLARKVNVYPSPFILPAPFGHIYKEGFGDTSLGFKSPIDLLEYNLRAPKDEKEARDLLEHANPENLLIYADRQSSNFETPRDKLVKELGIRHPKVLKNETFRWYDITDLHSRNMGKPPPMRSQVQYPERLPDERVPKLNGLDRVGDLKFNELYEPPKKENFTTCDEFGHKAYFYPNDVINLEWIPFYVWSNEHNLVAVPHRFTYATKKLVTTYRTLYGDNKDIEWHKVKLVLKGKGHFLLIAIDKRGLFHALPLLALPDNFHKLNVSLPHTQIRMKIVDPYLALMFCEQPYASIMAVADNVPPTGKEKRLEAEVLDFHGPGATVVRNLEEEEREKQFLRKIEIEREMPSTSGKPDLMAPQLPLPN